MPTLLEIAQTSREAIKKNKISKVENGEYDVEIETPLLKNRNDGQGSYILIPLRILEGRYEDVVIPDIFSFHPYKVRSAIYNLEDLLDTCSIELDDDCYRNVSTLFSALEEEISSKTIKLHIKYTRDGSLVRIDYLSAINNEDDDCIPDDPFESDDYDEPIDLSGIPF